MIADSDIEEEELEEDAESSSDEQEQEDGIIPDEMEDLNFIRWQRDTPPVQPDISFTGSSGPKHVLSPEHALPFEYFCLFIPIWFWPKIAIYTNKKAHMVEQEQDGLIRNWYATCGAEIKAWFAAVLVWCMCKTLSFEQFYQQSIDPGLVKKWFPSWKGP
jgi:hypothetical protein